MNKLDRLKVQKEEFESWSSFHTYFKNREGNFMLRNQSKEKGTADRGVDMTASEVSSRIQFLKRRMCPAMPASLLEDKGFSKTLKAAVFNGTEKEKEMTDKTTQGTSHIRY